MQRLRCGSSASVCCAARRPRRSYCVRCSARQAAEYIWEHAKSIDGIDPFYNIRSKKLYDVVDENAHIGWSVNSIQWGFYNECEFELVIQQADVYKKAADLGFEPLDSSSDPNRIGAVLLKHR